MIVLGVNGFFNADHDAGSCLVVDQKVVAAVEEERLGRVKRAPHQDPGVSALEVLSLGDIDHQAVDVVAYPWVPEPLGLDPMREAERILQTLRARGVRLRRTVEVRFVPHHQAHAWVGLTYLPVQERHRAAVLALDGSGESTSGALFHVREGRPTLVWHLPLESSLGAFYEGATAAIGFAWGQEGKTMGLASYGTVVGEFPPLPTPEARRFEGPLPQLSHDYLTIVKGFARQLTMALGEPNTFMERAKVAAFAQEHLTRSVKGLIGEADAPTIVLSGGTALNCAMNGDMATWLAHRGQRLVVPPPANDAGVALGAAVAVASEEGPVEQLDTALLGREFTTGQIGDAMTSLGARMADCSTEHLVDRLRAGETIGWFAGRAEIGPRALGARCVIARPDSEALRDRINVAKGRESWRPLAPSVTSAEFERSFEGCPSRYMLKASLVRPGAQGLRGVTHVDGTARPQVVPPAGTYSEVVAGMGSDSTPQAVICTSFNRAGEPIVYSPRHALLSARSMGLQALAGNGWIVDLARRS
ncbi:hypothetical protein H5397_10600 [Propioniciclava sp. MC1683]|nr:hypothetical protein [Propioniciclava sp. MC1683]